MQPPSPKRGVEVAKSLFAKPFSDRISQGPRILTVIQDVVVYGSKENVYIKAKLDTGAKSSSIDIKLAKRIGLNFTGETVLIKSASGIKNRKLVNLTFQLAEKKITSIASVVDRSKLQYPMIIGRDDMQGFLINPVYHD